MISAMRMQHSSVGKMSFAAFLTKEASKKGIEQSMTKSNISIMFYLQCFYIDKLKSVFLPAFYGQVRVTDCWGWAAPLVVAFLGGGRRRFAPPAMEIIYAKEELLI